MKLVERKHPDCLADSCIMSLNWIAAGSRLFRYIHGFFFSFLHVSFQTCLSLNIFKQAVGPSVLQTFSLCAVKPNKKINNKYFLYFNYISKRGSFWISIYFSVLRLQSLSINHWWDSLPNFCCLPLSQSHINTLSTFKTTIFSGGHVGQAKTQGVWGL